MAQAGYAFYDDGDFQDGSSAGRVKPLPLAISIFADRTHLRDEMREDALAAGLRVGQCVDLARLVSDEALPLGDAVMLDCPQVDASMLAALSRLDMRAARSSVQIVVSTSVAALDEVFACLDQSGAQILVDPSRSERLVALGRMLGSTTNANTPARLREMSEEDRLALLRLTEQVERLAHKLQGNRFDGGVWESGRHGDEGGTINVESPSSSWRGEGASSDRIGTADGEGGIAPEIRPALPDSRLIRRIIRQRQLRARFFAADFFADPAWDILLDLTAARTEQGRVSVTSLCIASGVPPTTALRWIAQMTDAGLLQRVEDENDRRRAFITLTDKAADAMARFFAALGEGAQQLV